jgi:hypothetical protein
MKLIPALCCNALFNPIKFMVEPSQIQYPLACQLLRFIAYLLAGGMIAQFFSCLIAYFLIGDSQAAGMVAQLIVQHLSYYFLGCAFVILSLANMLIKRGVYSLRKIRFPSLSLILVISVTSFLLIPRMDYLRETALLDGMPVMLSHFANYFLILNGLTLILVLTQIFYSTLMAWNLSGPQSS